MRRSRLAAAISAATLTAALAGTLAVPAPSGALTQDERFVTRLYTDLVLAEPTPDELTWWNAYLGGGGTRATVVNSLITGESVTSALALAAYSIYLDRLPTTAETTSAETAIAAGDLPDLEITLAGSAAFFTRTGSSNQTFVEALYDIVLRRTGSAGDVAYWTGQLNTAAKTRTQVATSFIKSLESNRIRVAGPAGLGSCIVTTISAAVDLFAGAYCLILDRMASTTDRDYWAGFLQSHDGDLRDLIAALASSSEYYLSS